MSTIKISQLGNVSAFTDETIIPVVANVAGTLTTLKTDGDTLKTFVLGTVETDIANTSANVTTLFANAEIQAGQISNITLEIIPLVNSNVANLQSNLSAVTSEVGTLSGNVSYLLDTTNALTANVNTLITNVESQSEFISNITNGTATFGNLIPSADVTYDLGSETARWKDLWLSGDTINLGGSTISQVGGAIVFSALPGVDVGLRNVIGWQDYANDVNIAIGQTYTIDSTMGTWGDLGNPGPGPYLDGAVPGIRYAFGVEPVVPAQWAFTYDPNGFVNTITLVSAGDPIQFDDQFEFVWFPNATSTITPVYLGEASTDPIDTTDTIWNADGKELYINRDASTNIVSVTGTGWTGADIIPGGLDGRFAVLKLPDDSVVFDGIDGPSIGAVEDCFALSYFIVRTETSYSQVATTFDIPVLGNVALSDDYNDLINTPVLSNVAISGDFNDLIGTPNLANVATTGDFNDLNNLPVLGNVAFTDDYNDLINTPNLAAISEAVLSELETIITDGNITYGNLIPGANVTYSLGSEIAQWKDLYLSGSTIYLGGTAISIVEGNLSVGGVEVSDGADGASAYEIAVANGYSDNEVAWLASLVGPAGADGIDGLDGAPGSLSALTTVAKTGGDIITPTAIDLTKNVNKLTSGRYTLADGVEGQLMYIVPQHSSGAVDMLIEVANADLGIGAVINQDLVFKGDGTSQVITLIFTDGAWSQSGGEWIF